MIRRIEVSGDIDFSMSINEGINIMALEEGKALMTDILELYRHLRMRN